MGFSHVDNYGNAVMVDVSEKEVTRRKAVATGSISMNEKCFRMVQERTVKKGDVLGVAQVAGIMAAKNTAQLIPLCHSLNLTKSKVEFNLHPESCEIHIVCTVCCNGQTGVEMEALTGASVGLLTVYDMCKSMDKNMIISNIHLVEKTGGKSGDFRFSDAGADDNK